MTCPARTSLVAFAIVGCALLATSSLSADSQAPSPTTEKKKNNVETQPMLKWDLSEEIYTPDDIPPWVLVEVPDWVKPFQGKNGSPEPWYSMPGSTCRGNVQGIDRYQANHYIVFRPETEKYLYDLEAGYTPADVGYVPGTLPAYERIVDKYTHSEMTDTEKALALLMVAMPDILRHPDMPPLPDARVQPDRNLLDEPLLESGAGWCNEQARVYIRLCQVAGIQARLIHLFGQSHTVAEFLADGQWVMVDASWYFVARDEDGKLLSAADCHDQGAGQRAYADAKHQRFQQLLGMSDEQLNIPEARSQRLRRVWQNFDAEKLAERQDLAFGVMNTPLPPPPAN